MTKTVKWSRYLWLSLLCFSFFLLELVSIFGIEMLFLRVDVWAYTPDQRALLCLAGCKVMTFIDWQTLKIIGEARGKTAFQFCAQYLYYLLEVGLVCLILLWGQKAFEVKLGRQSGFPFGGLVLAASWGAFHFISRGVGLELWNGVSCMIFSLLAGVIYVRMKKRFFYAYALIAVGYLL